MANIKEVSDKNPQKNGLNEATIKDEKKGKGFFSSLDSINIITY
jgi:hypothetical protein